MNCMWKHVTLVTLAFVLAADGKWLTGWASRNQFDAISPLVKLDMADIVVEQT